MNDINSLANDLHPFALSEDLTDKLNSDAKRLRALPKDLQEKCLEIGAELDSQIRTDMLENKQVNNGYYSKKLQDFQTTIANQRIDNAMKTISNSYDRRINEARFE